MDGVEWDAILHTPPEDAPEGAVTVVLSNEEILTPENAEFGEFSIVEATAEEREVLKKAGFAMPDWDPLQGIGCGGCHAEHVKTEEEPPEAEVRTA
jgi:hypothetical protein